MKIVEQSFKFIKIPNGEESLKMITKIGYVSHGTNKDITEESAKNFVKRHCIESVPQHGTLLEFCDIIVNVVTDRAIANEFVRHRIASYNQESTRYVWENELEVIAPLGLKEKSPRAYLHWYHACEDAEKYYQYMKIEGATAEECRDVLPLSTATKIVMKLNYRSWRNFFYLRADKHAHPKARQLANILLKEFKKRIPVVFSDFEVD